MPVIANQHQWKNKEHVENLLSGWPDDCYVQWGGSGIVLSRTEGARKTSFFEAFPKSGGFIRGEGATIVEAEATAYARYLREIGCEGHMWSRRNYTNGGCFCRRCGAFRVVMKEIKPLGGWKKPLTAFDIEFATMGLLRPEPGDDASSTRRKRRIVLRLSLIGVQLPDPEPFGPRDARRFDDAYGSACRDAIFTAFKAKGGLEGLGGDSSTSLISDFFGALSSSSVKHDYNDWLARKTEPEAEAAAE